MEFSKAIINLYNSDEYQKLKAYYSKRSTLDILGVARNELAHSNMLAWILNPKETHGLGLFPVRKFLQLLVMAKLELSANATVDTKAEFDEKLLNAILTNDCVVEGALIETEKSVDSTGDKHKDSRIDIYAEVSLRYSKTDNEVKVLPVVVENKVDSKEHDDQTKSYYDWCIKEVDRNRGKGYIKPLFVFLTPQRTLSLNEDTFYKEVHCSCNQYIRINYQYIVDYLIEQCLKQTISDDTRRVLNDYLRSLTYIYINGDINEGGSYMALSENERELLTRFWNNNENLLVAVLEAYGEREDTSEDVRNNIRRVTNSMSKRDFTKYQIEGIDNGPFNKGRMVLEVVKKHCQKNPEITFDGLKEAFNRDEIKCGFGGVVVQEEKRQIDPRGRKRYFDNDGDIIELKDGTRVCVCSNWGSGNIEPFIKRAKELGFKVTPVTGR